MWNVIKHLNVIVVTFDYNLKNERDDDDTIANIMSVKFQNMRGIHNNKWHLRSLSYNNPKVPDKKIQNYLLEASLHPSLKHSPQQKPSNNL